VSSLSPSGTGTAGTPTPVDFHSTARGDLWVPNFYGFEDIVETLWPAVREKPFTYMIEGEEVGPDYGFGAGHDPTARQYRMMKKYALRRWGFDCAIPIPGIRHRLWSLEEIKRYLNDIPGTGHSPVGWFPCDLDAIDGNHRNRWASNLRPACHSHNSTWSNTGRALIGEWTAAGAGAEEAAEERKRMVMSALTPIEKRILDLSRGYDNVGRTFIFQLVQEYEKHERDLDPDVARVKLRNEIGCSRPKSYDIMERLTTGDDSPMIAGRDKASGKSLLKFRHESDTFLTVNQLNEKYPSRGYITRRGVTFE